MELLSKPNILNFKHVLFAKEQVLKARKILNPVLFVVEKALA
jgi:hypothetical protein